MKDGERMTTSTGLALAALILSLFTALSVYTTKDKTAKQVKKGPRVIKKVNRQHADTPVSTIPDTRGESDRNGDTTTTSESP